MVRVTCRHSEKAYAITALGHAGYSSQGNDIVCAGVSAIIYALLGFLNNAPDKEKNLRAHAESGETCIFWSGKSVEVEAAFQMAVIGLLQISSAYPEHIQVDYAADNNLNIRDFYPTQ